MISPCGVRSRALAPEFILILSGFRAIRSIVRTHESVNRIGRLRPDRSLPNFPLAIKLNRGYDSGVGLTACDDRWKFSNNSAKPIQREPFVSRSLRLSDSQAQPSPQGGTQGNNGYNSPLAGGIKSRTVRSHLSLALGEFVRRNSRSPRRGTGRCGLRSNASAEAKCAAPNCGIQIDVRNRKGSQVSFASLRHSPPAQ